MRTLQPFLIFFCGAVFALFLYQLFGNSLFYSNNEKTDVKPARQVLNTKEGLSAKALDKITSDLLSIKGDLSSLREDLQDLANEEKISNTDIDLLSKFESIKEEIKTLHQRIDKGLKNKDSNQVSSFLPSASQEKASDKKSIPPELDITALMNASATARRENLAKLDDEFKSEARDEQWSLNMKQKITVFFENDKAAQSSVSSMDCHSTICQIEVKHDNKEAEEKFSLEFPFSLGSSFSSTTFGNRIEDPDGSSSVVMYLGN